MILFFFFFFFLNLTEQRFTRFSRSITRTSREQKKTRTVKERCSESRTLPRRTSMSRGVKGADRSLLTLFFLFLFFFLFFFLSGIRVLTVRKVGIECTLRNACYKSLFSAQVVHTGLGSNVKLDVDITRYTHTHTHTHTHYERLFVSATRTSFIYFRLSVVVCRLFFPLN